MPGVKKGGPEFYKVVMKSGTGEVTARIKTKTGVKRWCDLSPEREARIYYRGFLAGCKRKDSKKLIWL